MSPRGARPLSSSRMSAWLVALAAGIAVGALQYGRGVARPAVLPLALLRAAAVTLVVALLLDAPAGRARRVAPVAALDASASMRRAGDAAWRAAADSARAAGGDSLWLFGDSVRAGGAPAQPADAASRLRPVAERAAAAGRPVVVVTDAEIDDPESVDELPAGSRVVALFRPPTRDLAIASLDVPRAAVAGDTVSTTIVLVAGGAGAQGGRLELRAGEATVASAPVVPLAAWGERSVALRGVVRGAEGPVVLAAVATSAGDAETRNDTLRAVLELSRAPAAVFVSTRPDVDGREALAVLRGALAVPVRAWWRVAPGVWRADGSFAPASEAEVRAALRGAPVVVLHGDTAALGAPRAVTAGALALLASTEDEGEWYPSGAPPSPLAGALSALPWDSLPPVSAGAAPRGDWVGLEARLGRAGPLRALVAGSDEPRRVVVVAASGLWRWRLRGGASADAHAAVWGSVFDWPLAGGRDLRPATAEATGVREGEPVRWRRGASTDSVVRLVLSRRGVPARGDSVTLRFAAGTTVAESPALAAGLYEVQGPGLRTLLAVNPSREWLPRRPTVRSLRVAGTPTGAAPGARRLGWLYALAIAALCAEWLLRRRVGMR